MAFTQKCLTDLCRGWGMLDMDLLTSKLNN